MRKEDNQKALRLGQKAFHQRELVLSIRQNEALLQNSERKTLLYAEGILNGGKFLNELTLSYIHKIMQRLKI